MSTTSFYSFSIEEDNDSCSYEFYSPLHQRLYSINFDAFAYQHLLSDFPILLQNGCALEIGSFSVDKEFSKKNDPDVENTLIEIIKHYLRRHNNEYVLIYHCDTNDNRQRCRDRLFENWFSKFNNNNEFYKDRVMVELPLEDGTKRDYYLGFITNNSNPNIKQLKEEFTRFSYVLPTNKPQ